MLIDLSVTHQLTGLQSRHCKVADVKRTKSCSTHTANSSTDQIHISSQWYTMKNWTHTDMQMW